MSSISTVERTSVVYNYKYLVYLSMLFITLRLITTLTAYKIIDIDGDIFSAANLILPFWFFIGDVIAEIYGFKIAKKLIIAVLILELFFAILFSFLIGLHSPDSAIIKQNSYNEVFQGIFRTALSGAIAIAISGICNIYIATKSKSLLLGKSFILRSFFAVCVAELIFTITANFMNYSGILNFYQIIGIISNAFLIKFIMNFAFILPTSVITSKIKKLEGFSLYDTNLSDIVNRLPQSTKITQMYTASNNKTYFKDIEMEIPMLHELGYYSIEYPASAFKIREFKPGSTIHWHTTPNERYIIYLSGEIQIEVSSGEKRIFKSGDILLATDTTGEGHNSSTITAGRSVIILV